MVASRKTRLQSDMTSPESMTLTEILPTTNFSVKLMHDCTTSPLARHNHYQGMVICSHFYIVGRKKWVS